MRVVPGSITGWWRQVTEYWALSKPRIWMVFAVEGAVGSMLAWAPPMPFPWVRVSAVILVMAWGAAGAEALTNVLDLAMDRVMQRTHTRPLPSGAVRPASAVVFGLVCIAFSLTTSAFLGLIPLLFVALGLIDNIVIYSALSKRFSPWSIVLGSGSGAIPIWVGFSALKVPISLNAWLLGVVILCWIPVHIWSVAWAYRDDYARAGVPMAPVVWSAATFRRSWYGALALLGIMSGLFAVRSLPLWLASAVILATFLIGFGGYRWVLNPTAIGARRIFGAINGYLVGFLLLIIVSRL